MDLRERVIETLRQIVDPHTGVSVYEMGLISELKVEKDAVTLTFIPTSPVCPMGLQLARDIKEGVCKIEGIKKCVVNVVGHMQADLINRQLNQC
jgi:metal-sulfur cluster biosynthetic enzyme